MSILTDRLPRELLGVPVRADFRDMIRLECLLLDETLPETVRYAAALELFYAEPVADADRAWQTMLWFYGGGHTGHKKQADGGAEQEKPRPYDFEQDADLIYAAFWAQYGIDLTEVEFLHWWKFRALFLNLDEQQQISRIMGWRTVDTKGMDRKTAARYRRLKRIYALTGREKAAASLAERDRRMREKVARQFAEAGKSKRQQ